MEQAHVQRLERLIEYDPEGCRCHEQGIAKLCKAKDLGLELFAECLEEDPSDCASSLTLEDSHYCYCPLLVYMVNKQKK